MENLKPHLNTLIQYYYRLHPTGGNLHIVLDNGNVDMILFYDMILFCEEQCKQEGDTLGLLLCEVLFMFTEDERMAMYEKDFWGMAIPVPHQNIHANE